MAIKELTVKSLMQGKTPNPEYTGWVTNDDNVLAVGIPGHDTTENDYIIAEIGVAGLDSNMNPITQDKQYIRAGQSTTKTGTQRTFQITADRYIGDTFQDYCLSHKVKYGTGNAVVVPYVYFNILTGKGEKGTVSIIVESDGSGNAGESAGVSINLNKIGSMPEEYTYTPAEILNEKSNYEYSDN